MRKILTMNRIISIGLFVVLGFLIIACDSCEPDTPKQDPVTTPEPPKKVNVPKFEKDSAFTFVKKQVDFGNRVVNSPGHKACKEWLVGKMEGYADNVIQQNFSAKAYTGTPLNGTNIIAQFNPQAGKRILLAAHWDTRHIADSDLEKTTRNKPIDGADDGGSGVGVLLEVARLLKERPIEMGVDIILFDAEDHGDENDGQDPTSPEEQEASMKTWCLGSQHWSKNLHTPGYKPKFGILLDMVGSKNARFAKEGYSMQAAPSVMNKVWKLAKAMGYSNYFKDEKENGVIDDHLFVIQNARIPMIDIINLSENKEQTFGDHWHTQNDNIEVIDPRTLRAVGQVVLAVVYGEANGTF